jgi:hypothetical protein
VQFGAEIWAIAAPEKSSKPRIAAKLDILREQKTRSGGTNENWGSLASQVQGGGIAIYKVNLIAAITDPGCPKERLELSLFRIEGATLFHVVAM